MAGTVSEVTDNNFQAEVIESDTPVLVDFWAPWCGPCRMVAPVVEEIAKERGEDLKVVKLNIDENQATAMQFNVMSIPTLILFRNGQAAKTVIGAYPEEAPRGRTRARAGVSPAPPAVPTNAPNGARASGPRLICRADPDKRGPRRPVGWVCHLCRGRGTGTHATDPRARGKGAREGPERARARAAAGFSRIHPDSSGFRPPTPRRPAARVRRP